ncbi:MAG TPA: DHA2 family efflux MFS transporter permease subunit [Rubrobacteraceae bacterium]|nr:DHA2 family efflux MFS transporter permease subunit [Rubrobacteraceae bacterium]
MEGSRTLESKGAPAPGKDDRKRWLALLLVCAAQLMIVLDGTIVNVALPVIQSSLGFSQVSLSWVVNAYLLTFGGFLLLGGRAGDLFGRRRVFMAGLALFTLASLFCGLAGSQALLVAARAVQGLGGAIIAPAALSIIITTFTEPADRARAMGIWGFVVSGGASIGVLLGGVLVGTLGWPWIFLVNLPIGIVALALCRPLLEAGRVESADGGFDLAGALLVTASLVAAVYAIVGANTVGWTSAQTIILLAVAASLMGLFVAVEARTRVPLVPLGIFRSRNLTVSNVAMVLTVAGMFGWFFFSALYLQRVLGYGSLQTGLAFLPATLVLGALSYSAAAKAVNRFGIKPMLMGGMALLAVSLLLFARAPAEGSFLVDVLPGMLLLGLGASFAFLTLILASVSGVPERDAGLASGLVNTAQQLGGALGLAVLASVAASQTEGLGDVGSETVAALNGGYHAAFLLSATFVALAAVLAAALLKLDKNGKDIGGIPADAATNDGKTLGES